MNRPSLCQPRAGRSHIAALLLAVSLGLSACQRDTDTPPPASATQSEAQQAIWQEFGRIEREGRARARESEQRLQALQASTQPASAERLELLALRGLMAAYNRDRPTLEAVQRDLDHWPLPAAQPSAELAIATMRALDHQVRGDLREAVAALAMQALKSQQQQQLSPQILWRARLAWASIKSDSGMLDEALSMALEAVKQADSMGQSWRRAVALNELSYAYTRAQQPEQAQRASAEALAAAKEDPAPLLMHSIFTMRGIAYAQDADPSHTQRAWEQALQYAREAGADGALALSLANYSDHHLRRGEYERALELASQALPLARREQALSIEVLALHNMGLAKIGLKRVAEGTRDVRQAITLDEQQGALAYAAEGWRELGQYLEKAGDWGGAIEAHHAYRRLIDQVLREDTRKTVLETQASYEAERRAKEIELLNHDNSLKAERIRAHELEIKLWATLAACVLICAVLLGMSYRRIRRTNAALASSNESLKLQSERDPLTGLSNRRHFQAAIKRLADAGGLSGTVYLIDIDHFKRINDQWGHAAGDSVLIEVARRLRSALREDDLVVRWGGEEFLIIVPSREAEGASTLAQRLLRLLALPVQHGAVAVPISASIGFASFPVAPHGLSLGWERAIDLVDTVMYMAKAHGRNKAYGVEHADARNEQELDALARQLEQAWQQGRVGLVAINGPVLEGAP
ncbi:GGDEF domain-containing protein [Kinneretia asaccharophila]|uniref:diguanylate cyclase n=1 Tax=Roseateles asaccharophilus TaxID=582607 RepID=A0A4V3CKA7_9BURK|nr:GGDEF domain-containing protein [Roseateles asaccharophilus]MDN3543144.1 GGDEF domain-containing protein [Roseateles asaccharophilus]TDP13157.1 diguanylate cyclase (GGDEF)-like protein [Roseateles asaccharophilus]